MIPFLFNLRPEREKEQVVRQYARELLSRASRPRIEELDEWCRMLHARGARIPYSFEQIIQLPFEELKKILPDLDPKKLAEKDRLPEHLARYMTRTLYKKHVPRERMIDELGVMVCPYCNRAYINRTPKHTVCQLDHFFSKTDYPILAVSFYNLVPCCGTCNLIKHEAKLGYSPYDRNAVSGDDLVEFRYRAVNYNQMTGEEVPDKIDILHKRPDMEENIKVLELEKIYQIHRDIAWELIEKKKIYKGHYAEYLREHYPDLLINPERLITGNYTKPDEYGKRPLAKMTADISRQLKLIPASDESRATLA